MVRHAVRESGTLTPERRPTGRCAVTSVRRASLAIAMITVLAVTTACSRSEPHAGFQAFDVTGADWGRDFHLFDAAGTARSLADYRGKVVMLFFGYTNCPDECPTTLARMAQAVDRLGPNGAQVQVLFVTVDPKRDTPAILAQFVHRFHPAFVGLSADEATTAATAKEFKVYYKAGQPDEHGVYAVEHNSGIFVFDASGRLRLYMHANAGVDAMVHDLGLLLRDAPKAPQP
jgi:protein SCO1/2